MNDFLNTIEKNKIDFYQSLLTLFEKNKSLDSITLSIHQHFSSHPTYKKYHIKIQSIHYNHKKKRIIYLPVLKKFIPSTLSSHFIKSSVFYQAPYVSTRIKKNISRLEKIIQNHILFQTELPFEENYLWNITENRTFKRNELKQNKNIFYGEILNKKLEVIRYNNFLPIHHLKKKSLFKI